MTEDLKATLEELGPGYRAVVARLRAPFEERSVRDASLITHHSSFFASTATFPRWLVAASFAAAIGFAVVFLRNVTATNYPSSRWALDSPSAPAVYTAAYASDEFALQAILDSQRRDGSWSNDFLTRQNAAALRRAHDDASRVAYKRAVRYLRTKGLSPLSEAEMSTRAMML